MTRCRLSPLPDDWTTQQQREEDELRKRHFLAVQNCAGGRRNADDQTGVLNAQPALPGSLRALGEVLYPPE